MIGTPAAGNDPSKGPQTGILIRFLLNFLDFPEFWPIILQNYSFICEKWAGNTPELSRIYLEVVSDLKSVWNNLFWVSKLDL